MRDLSDLKTSFGPEVFHDVNRAFEMLDDISRISSKEIFVSQLGVKPRAPFIVIATREAILLRIEETARAACECLIRREVCASAILSRSSLESAAFIWRLRDLVNERKSYESAEFEIIVRRLALGWKSDKQFPEAINVITMIDRMNKIIEGAKRRYDSLSEIAHPNWGGVIGMYCNFDQSEYKAEFDRKSERYIDKSGSASSAVYISLMFFNIAYNDISDLMPKWLEELEKI